MTAMLLPSVHSYFAIYTLEPADRSLRTSQRRGFNWDLHATATDKSMAISHARMLALQPGITEVHVKQVTENLSSGQVSVRNVKRCRRGVARRWTRWCSYSAAIACIPLVAHLFFS